MRRAARTIALLCTFLTSAPLWVQPIYRTWVVESRESARGVVLPWGMRNAHGAACPLPRLPGTRCAMSTFERKGTNAESLGLDHLRSFLAVVESGSQVRAARRLRVGQPTVCRHIERVQEHFGGGLFEAGSSGRLSTRGLLVEQSVRQAMAELSRTRDRLAHDRPVLRIGFARPVGPLVQRALRAPATASGVPAFDVRLQELTSEMQARALERRELDIAISYALPQLADREGIEASIVTEEPFALVIPERAWVNGKPSRTVLSSLLYAHSPRRLSTRLVAAEDQWLRGNRLEPKRRIECELGSEILAYAQAGLGFGFLPALWSMAGHDGVVFAPIEFAVTAKISAYSLQHVTPSVTRLRESLSASARAALLEFRKK
jgi:DNA-binding transcriptional LysR family regulator